MILPYYFTGLPSGNYYEYEKKLVDTKHIVCFDLEDSIGCFDPKQTAALKNLKRVQLTEALAGTSNLNLPFIGIRLNDRTTPYYIKDLNAIKILKNLHCVFIPKIESALQLSEYLDEIPEHIVEVIPIIESDNGFKNLEQILSINNQRFTQFAFGHCDYNLSKGYFPFYHQCAEQYWEWIAFLSSIAKQCSKQLINSPCLDLNNTDFFTNMLWRLQSYPNISGQITLCIQQTIACDNLIEMKNPANENKIQKNQDVRMFAEQIIFEFENNKKNGQNFALNNDRLLISPHEYISARKYLTERTETGQRKSGKWYESEEIR